MGRHSGLGHADDTDGDTAAGVAHGLAVVIGLFVNDETAADDRARAVEGQVGIDEIDHGVAVLVGLDVAQVTDVPFGSLPLAVQLGSGVEMASRRFAIRRPDTEFVDVEPVLTRASGRRFLLDADPVLGLSERHAPRCLALLGGQEDRDGLVDLCGGSVRFLFFLAGDRGTAEAREGDADQGTDRQHGSSPFLIDMSFLP